MSINRVMRYWAYRLLTRQHGALMNLCLFMVSSVSFVILPMMTAWIPFATRFAEHTGRLVATRHHVVALRLVVALAHHYGLNSVDTVTQEQEDDPYPTLNRWADMAWVRRRLRAVSARRLYDAAREHALISARLAAYTTDLSLARRAYRLAHNDETLSALVAHNADDVLTR